ncbi:hypothetical protein FJY71_09630, partial [candidate division WOR-3 bacterium]|nr:hypothetical protein [candidate division WOR-3 bacterium]
MATLVLAGLGVVRAAGPDTLLPPFAAPVDPGTLADSIGSVRGRLDQTREDLDRLDRELNALSEREQASLSQLEVCEQRIRTTVEYLRLLASQARQRSREIAGVTATMDTTSAEMSSRRRVLARRMVGIYKCARVFPLQAFFSTRSLPELYRRVLDLRWVARADRRLLEDLRALARRLDEQRSQLLAARADLERLVEETRQQETELQQARATEASLLQQV